MVTHQGTVSQVLQVMLHKTAAIGAFLGYQTHGMNFSMLTYCQWNLEPSNRQTGKRPTEETKNGNHLLPYEENSFNFKACTRSPLLFRLLPPHFLQSPLRWFPFPSLSQAASRDLIFQVHMWMVSAMKQIVIQWEIEVQHFKQGTNKKDDKPELAHIFEWQPKWLHAQQQ